MSDSIKEEIHYTEPEFINIETHTLQDLIPLKSRKVYDFAYKRFLNWAQKHEATHYSENELLAYFKHLSSTENMKMSTLWSHYSMLKAELNINHNIHIKNYTKLVAFLKSHNSDYKPKKSEILSKQQIDNFLRNAPDEKYLATKVILILGVSGACRCDELMNLTMKDIEDLGSVILVKVTNTKNNKSRSFTILGELYLEICRKYMVIRKDININRFLIKYHDGKCAKKVMGIHKIGSAPREIASFLKLPNCNEYTGHCLRRTSATLLVDNGGNITTASRHGGGWRFTIVAEGYIEDSIENKNQIVVKILTPINNHKPSTSDNLGTVEGSINNIEHTTRELEVTGGLKFENCKFENFHITVHK